MRVVESSETGRERRKAESVILQHHGTSNQRERWTADLLPEDELLTIVRAVLFEPFVSFRRWQKLFPQDVKHDKSCSGGAIVFRTRSPDDLTAGEWAIYQEIGRAAHGQHKLFAHYGANFLVELIEHVGACTVCPAEVFGRAASIRIEWAGRQLSREYSLDVP